MKPPSYQWSCHACKASNVSGAVLCSACGFPAVASGRSIEREAKSLQQQHQASRTEARSTSKDLAHSSNDWALFFPEGLLAGAVLVASPFWAANLAHKGAYAAASALMFCASLGTAIAFFALRRKNKWLLYVAVLVVLAGAWAAS
jgi:ribosomal protein L37E